MSFQTHPVDPLESRYPVRSAKLFLFAFSFFLFLTVAKGASTLPVITSATSASGKVESSFSYQITATNSPSSYGATGLPTGLRVNTRTGVISGTPTAAGTSRLTLSVTNRSGKGTATLTLTISAEPPVITSATSASGKVGSAFSYHITATNAPTSYGASGLPGGLSVNSSTGLISGTPTAAATSTVTLSATNSTGTGNATLTLSIAAALPVITSATSASGKVGSAFSYQITATNSPTSYGATGLPAGLTVSSTTGLISGTPTAAATSTVTLSATNSTGTGNTTLTLSIAAAMPVITSATSASGTVGSAFSYQIAATNTPTSYGATGLPAGLTVSSSTGLISGTPTAPATSTVTLGATNSTGTGNATLTFTIAACLPTLTSLSPASALVGSGTQTLTLTGTNFLATSTVTYNAVAHAATFVSSTQLTISLSATDVAAIGAYPVVVTNTGQGGGASSSISFTVTGPVVSLSPTSLSFGNEALEMTSSSQVVTLSNTGNTSLTLSSLTFAGVDASDFTEANTCGSSVAAGGTCTIAVMFTPAAAGSRSAALSINDNAGASPQSVSLSGSGIHDVMLSWAASTTPGILGYYVYRGTTSGGESSTPLNSTPLSSSSFTDESVTAGATYYYLVTAVASNDVTQSPASNEASATVPTP
ncbi:MAG: beta strand repeat-containing protein [Terriglobia bacterium]